VHGDIDRRGTYAAAESEWDELLHCTCYVGSCG
jgi:hypothetical protein